MAPDTLTAVAARIERVLLERDTSTQDRTQTIGSLVLAENVAQTEFLRIIAELLLYIAQRAKVTGAP